ncbi:DUF3037 domain-containing protein [Flavobacteriaceae bacterium Ap0902]|nr:DUF3037 domain-containing protein [Flavobacteriaceae bacterium Ap0902]
MRSFYSIIKLSPNIATEDSIAIGMLLYDGEKFLYFFSDKKEKLAKKLLTNVEVNLDFILNQIRNKLDYINNDKTELKTFYKYDNLSDVKYFEYLSNYSNGLLQFSKPKIIFNEIDNDFFENLVRFFFKEDIHNEGSPELSKNNSIYDLVWNKLIVKVAEKVHTNYKFKPKTFPSIFFNYELDCIGLNGSLIGAKTLDFDKSTATLDKNISHYFTLISSLTAKYNQSLDDNNFFLISEEPVEIGSKAHQLWESVNYNNLISILPPEDSDKVADLILEKKASKFLD